jgi:hypothetical protein
MTSEPISFRRKSCICRSIRFRTSVFLRKMVKTYLQQGAVCQQNSSCFLPLVLQQPAR